MGVLHILKIAQMVPNHAKHHLCLLNSSVNIPLSSMYCFNSIIYVRASAFQQSEHIKQVETGGNISTSIRQSIKLDFPEICPFVADRLNF